ncbi:MAG: tripartite tricarboxylate transporter substrate binding protein [Burkholderiaceae bacterium]|nr:tripartite tricarboxylate transporter substrate binding protein [Burkholderiaceae bacterium]
MTSRARPPRIASHARRNFLLAGAGLAFAARADAADDWPQRPVRLIVPYAAGGSADRLGRAIAKYLTGVLPQPVVLENKGGAGGIVGSQMVAASAPDGYTLVVSGIGSHVIAPAAGGTFDPMKDFSHIALLGGPPLGLIVNSAQPYRTFEEFVAAARKPGDGISWASPGRGTHGHLTGEMLRALLKLNMTHIAYKGAGEAVKDVLANHVAAGCMTFSSARQFIDAGKFRLLAVTAPKRLPDYPGAPTLAELGYPQLTGTTWFSVSGPAGMPPDLVNRLNAEIRRGQQTPDYRQMLQQENMVLEDMDAAAFTRFVAAEIARWSSYAKQALTEEK